MSKSMIAIDASIDRHMRTKRALPVCDTKEAAKNRTRVNGAKSDDEKPRDIFDIRSYKIGND